MTVGTRRSAADLYAVFVADDVDGDVVAVGVGPTVTLGDDAHAVAVTRTHADLAREAVDRDRENLFDSDLPFDLVRCTEGSRHEHSRHRIADPVPERLHAFGETVGPAGEALFQRVAGGTVALLPLLVLRGEPGELLVELAFLFVQVSELALELGQRVLRLGGIGRVARDLFGSGGELTGPRGQLFGAVHSVVRLLVHPLLLFSCTCARFERIRARSASIASAMRGRSRSHAACLLIPSALPMVSHVSPPASASRASCASHDPSRSFRSRAARSAVSGSTSPTTVVQAATRPAGGRDGSGIDVKATLTDPALSRQS